MRKPTTSPSKRRKNGAARAIARPKSAAEYQLNKQHAAEYERQMDGALAYLEAEDEAGQIKGAVDRALTSQRWPLVKRASLFQRWKVRDAAVKKSDGRSILSEGEEELLVNWIKQKNDAHQSVSRTEIESTVIAMLQLRRETNRRGGTIIPLSNAALQTLLHGKLSQIFFTRFFADHPELNEGTASQTSQRRTGACTRGTAEKHIAGLVKVLTELGIMEADGTISPENCRRIFNCDETPQFINYAVCVRTLRRVGVKGKRPTKYRKEVRESVTISPMISLDGQCALVQVLFAEKHITREQVSAEIFKLFRDAGSKLVVGATEKGYQTSRSWLDFLTIFDKWLTEFGIVRPVVLLLDGHITRFDLAVLAFCRTHQIHVYLSPPDTTGLTQALDQINAALHYHYCATTAKWERYHQGVLLEQRLREARADLGEESINLEDELSDVGSDDSSEDDATLEQADADDHLARTKDRALHALNKTGFLRLLGASWKGFNKPESIRGAFRRTGVTPKKVSVDLMQQDKFKAADMLLNRAIGAERLATPAPRTGTVTLPLRTRGSTSAAEADADVCPDEYAPVAAELRRGTAGFWQHLYEEQVKVSASLRAQLAFFTSRPALPKPTDLEIFPFDRVTVREEGGRKRVGVGIYGSLEEAGALELIQASKEAEAAAAAAAADKAAEKEAKKKRAADDKAAADKEKEDRLAAFFACSAAREAQQGTCACGELPSACKSRKLKLCPTCKSLTASGCNKKGPCEAARVAARAPPVSPMDV